MNAKTLKIEALAYLRFERQLPYVSTEVSVYGKHGRSTAGGEADVFGASEASSVEIETKTSISDFKRDFTAKKPKHAAYRAGCVWAPNYLYYLGPEHLVKSFEVEQLLDEHQEKAGLLYLDTNPALRAGHRLVLYRKAEPLHRTRPDPALIKTIIKRMGSELCGLHIANQALAAGIDDISEKVLREVRGAIAKE